MPSIAKEYDGAIFGDGRPVRVLFGYVLRLAFGPCSCHRSSIGLRAYGHNGDFQRGDLRIPAVVLLLLGLSVCVGEPDSTH